MFLVALVVLTLEGLSWINCTYKLQSSCPKLHPFPSVLAIAVLNLLTHFLFTCLNSKFLIVVFELSEWLLCTEGFYRLVTGEIDWLGFAHLHVQSPSHHRSNAAHAVVIQ